MMDLQALLLSPMVQDVTRLATLVLVAPLLYLTCVEDLSGKLGRENAAAIGLLLAGYVLGFGAARFSLSNPTLSEVGALLGFAGLARILYAQAQAVSQGSAGASGEVLKG
ncbi:hypothetical protein [Niveibacterium sp. SC-1]|uniref:hypothetical protein n=1 Tax=Niveibacterium sp. SC-1 TaxID=3135646 RepID=UPI00311DF61F